MGYRPVTLPGKMYLTLMAVRKMSADRRKGHPDFNAAGLQEERSLLHDVKHVMVSAVEEVARFRSGSSIPEAWLTDEYKIIL